MICLGILWNGMQEHVKEAISDISCYGDVLYSFKIDLESDYEMFVRDIYSKDNIALWKVDKKIETMFECSDIRTVTVVFINIDTKETEYHPLKKRIVFTNIETMKTNIRKKYSNMVNSYFFDNVFHVTDNEKEFVDDLEVVEKYYEKHVNNDDINLDKQFTKILRRNDNNGIKKEDY